MERVRAQLWGGIQDGLRAFVEVGRFTGPPSFVDVPLLSPITPEVLYPRIEDHRLFEMDTVRYRLDAKHEGRELLYRVERMNG